MVTTNTYRDLRLNRSRDIDIGGGGDLELTTSRDENIAQSVAVTTSGIVRQILGGTVNANILERLVTIITQELNQDPQISTVISVQIEEINKVDNSITIRAVLTDDDDFIINLSE